MKLIKPRRRFGRMVGIVSIPKQDRDLRNLFAEDVLASRSPPKCAAPDPVLEIKQQDFNQISVDPATLDRTE